MSLQYHREHPRTKVKVKASFVLWQELTFSQEDGHWSKSAAFPNPAPHLPTLQQSPLLPRPYVLLSPHQKRQPLPSCILHHALHTLSVCLICWTSQLLPITEYKLIQPSKEAAENTGGSRGHHCTSKHQLLCVGSLYTT